MYRCFFVWCFSTKNPPEWGSNCLYRMEVHWFCCFVLIYIQLRDQEGSARQKKKKKEKQHKIIFCVWMCSFKVTKETNDALHLPGKESNYRIIAASSAAAGIKKQFSCFNRVVWILKWESTVVSLSNGGLSQIVAAIKKKKRKLLIVQNFRSFWRNGLQQRKHLFF